MPVKVAGAWCFVYRAVDEHGQIIEVVVSKRRDIAAARSFFAAAVEHVIAELLPDAVHNTGLYANDRVECDHGRLKDRLGPISPPEMAKPISSQPAGASEPLQATAA